MRNIRSGGAACAGAEDNPRHECAHRYGCPATCRWRQHHSGATGRGLGNRHQPCARARVDLLVLSVPAVRLHVGGVSRHLRHQRLAVVVPEHELVRIQVVVLDADLCATPLAVRRIIEVHEPGLLLLGGPGPLASSPANATAAVVGAAACNSAAFTRGHLAHAGDGWTSLSRRHAVRWGSRGGVGGHTRRPQLLCTRPRRRAHRTARPHVRSLEGFA